MSDLAQILARQRTATAAAGVPSAAERRSHLRALEATIKKHTDEFAAALSADFGNRSVNETRALEIFPAVSGARFARKHVAQWMKPEKRPVPTWFRPASARIERQPLGSVGIIVPWNYPINLATEPLVGALAAGNRVMLKMSELAPRVGEVYARAMKAAFSDDRVAVINGDVDVARAFAALPFDHLLFTGSTAIGRDVMRAAAANLTPVTLELGGKSPAIIGEDADIAMAAERILSGKCKNAGQTCVAPDYVLVHERNLHAFLDAARKAVATRYPTILGNPDYTSIVSDRHYERIVGYLSDATARGAKLAPLHPSLFGPDAPSRTIPPIAVLGTSDEMAIMHDEIFGPLLPVRTYRTLDAAIAEVNARPRPLALYYFGFRKRDVDRVLQATVSGGVTINDVIYHFGVESLPVGGVGPSGMGAYHGREGFETFTHRKPILTQGRIAVTGAFDPPYGAKFAALYKMLTG
jgi:acyl-CoA reductase-like NAD-dependent aldehyde dehydrogenase